MTNLELSWVFAEIGELLEIKGENTFKVRAYRRAARVLKNMEVEAADFYARDALEEIPGVGKSLAAKIAELLTTGQSVFLNDLRQEVPFGLRQMLALPGLGSGSVRRIYQGLGVKTLEELRNAARRQQIRTLPGMGSKTELAILRGLEMLERLREQIPLGIARPLALLMEEHLRTIPGVVEVKTAGSVRRGCEAVGDIDLVVAIEEGEHQLAEIMGCHPQVKKMLVNEPERLVLLTYLGIEIEIILTTPKDFTAVLFYATGSDNHRRHLLRLAIAKGLRASELGLNTSLWLNGEAEALLELQKTPLLRGGNLPAKGLPPDCKSDIKKRKQQNFEAAEAGVYSRLGLPYIVPELREDWGEVEAALREELPCLIESGDIRGDLHLHTNYSDGMESIAHMAMAARKRGYDYIAITDHSRSLTIARGLSIEELERQWAEIDDLNAQMKGFRILAGTEVDILADGRLDYEDGILERFDLVIASIHSGFNQSKEQIMARLEAALRHPYVDILGHPTGRMLGRRPPYAVDMERVIEIAAETGTILEINASPDRLDINAQAARLAKEQGVLVAINTDAHDPKRLAEIEYGILTARRGWLEPKDVINTRGLEDMLARLKRNRE